MTTHWLDHDVSVTAIENKSNSIENINKQHILLKWTTLISLQNIGKIVGWSAAQLKGGLVGWLPGLGVWGLGGWVDLLIVLLKLINSDTKHSTKKVTQNQHTWSYLYFNKQSVTAHPPCTP